MNFGTRLRDWWRGWSDADLVEARVLLGGPVPPSGMITLTGRQFKALVIAVPNWHSGLGRPANQEWLERWLANADETNSTLAARNAARLGLGMYPESVPRPTQIDARPLAKIRGWK